MAVARRRGVDTIRRTVTLQSKVELLGRELSDHETPMDEIEFDPHVEDDVLRLMFTACHPVLSVDARVALTLKMVAGLSTEAIARAFLVQPTTMAARITRAKKSLAEANVPFEVPVGEELADRLSSVLEAVYLVFNEGYTATAGEQWARAELCQEAMRLGRMLAALAAGESEAHALVALMEIQASRLRARTGPDGEIVTLDKQDRARWDRLLITHGLAALDRAEELGGTGSYAIQAQIAACHARAPRAEDTDWVRIASLYGDLVALTRSPIVELNRAVAVSMADGPAAGLAVTDGLRDVAVLRDLPPAAERARRPARQARPLRGGTSRVRACREPPRTRPSAHTCSPGHAAPDQDCLDTVRTGATAQPILERAIRTLRHRWQTRPGRSAQGGVRG